MQQDIFSYLLMIDVLPVAGSPSTRSFNTISPLDIFKLNEVYNLLSSHNTRRSWIENSYQYLVYSFIFSEELKFYLNTL